MAKTDKDKAFAKVRAAHVALRLDQVEAFNAIAQQGRTVTRPVRLALLALEKLPPNEVEDVVVAATRMEGGE